MPLHFIQPNHDSLHGRFSRDMPPILTTDSGETVRFQTLDVGLRITQIVNEIKGVHAVLSHEAIAELDL